MPLVLLWDEIIPHIEIKNGRIILDISIFKNQEEILSSIALKKEKIEYEKNRLRK